MSKRKKLIFMVIGVLVLVAAVIGISKYNAYKASQEPEESSSTVVLKNLYENDKSNISSVELQTQNENIVFLPGETTDSGDLEWYLEGHEDWSLNHNYNSIISMAAIFQVYKEIDTVTDESRLAEFGLAQPSSKLTVNLKDGTKQEVWIGSLSSDKTYAFCKMVGDDTVYACNANYASYAGYTLETLRLTTISAIDTKQELFSLFEQKKGERPIEIEYVPEEEQDTSASEYKTVDYRFVEPYHGAYTNVFQGLSADYFEKLTTPEFVETIDVSCTDFDQYGLGDEPEYREKIVTRTSSDNGYEYTTTDYYFGYTYGENDEYIYFREAGSDHVMGVDASCMDVRKFDPFYYLNKLIYIDSITNIKEGTITYGGETHSFTIKRQEASGESSVSNEDLLAAYRFDGELIDSDTFLSLYRMMISIAPDYEILNQTPDYDESDTVSFTVTYNDGRQETISFYRLSEFYYVTQGDDNTWFACGDSYIDKIGEKLEACMAAASGN